MERILFDRVSVINLNDRSDRLPVFYNSLPPDWPFQKPTRFHAIDGRCLSLPKWWKTGWGTWGCYRSHLNLLESALTDGLRSILVLEDDAKCVSDFNKKLASFVRSLPDDAGLVYFGGQHFRPEVRLPRKVNDWCYRPFGVAHTHAYAALGRSSIELLYGYLADLRQWKSQNLGLHLADLHWRLETGLYAPKEWLLMPFAADSDAGAAKMYPGAGELLSSHIDRPGVAVLAASKASASFAAGFLHHLGVNMSDPHFTGCFESEKLNEMCQMFFPDTSLKSPVNSIDRVNLLRRWASDKCRALGEQSQELFGGAHPALSLLGPDLIDAWQNPLFLSMEQPVNESLSSDSANFVRRIAERREKFLKRKELAHLRLTHESLRQQPKEVIERVSRFLGISPSSDQVHRAIAFATAEGPLTVEH